jgi:hypothetical protein
MTIGRRHRTISAGILTAAVLLLSACGTRPPAARKLKAELDRRAGQEVPGVIVTPKTVVPGIHVYFDASRSVRGFAPKSDGGAANTDYTRFIKNLHNWMMLKTNQQVTYFKFGSGISPVSGYEAALRRSFYEYGQTELVTVLMKIATSPTAPQAIFVITDGVPVGDGQMHDWQLMVQHVAAWIQRGYSFQIVKLQGEFNDMVFSIQKGEMLGEYRTAAYGKRPYYCYIFSTTPELGGDLLKYLRSEGSDPQFLNITGKVVTGCRARLMSPARYLTGPRQTEMNSLRRATVDKGTGFYFFHWTGRSPKPGKLELAMDIDMYYEAQNLVFACEGLEKSVCAISQIPTRPPRYENADAAVVSLNSRGAGKITGGSGTVRCTLDIRQPASTAWHAYRLDVKTGYGTIQPPDWVKKVSTESDATLEDWSKTMNFDRFVKSILGRERILTSVYFAIGRK